MYFLIFYQKLIQITNSMLTSIILRISKFNILNPSIFIQSKYYFAQMNRTSSSIPQHPISPILSQIKTKTKTNSIYDNPKQLTNSRLKPYLPQNPYYKSYLFESSCLSFIKNTKHKTHMQKLLTHILNILKNQNYKNSNYTISKQSILKLNQPNLNQQHLPQIIDTNILQDKGTYYEAVLPLYKFQPFIYKYKALFNLQHKAIKYSIFDNFINTATNLGRTLSINLINAISTSINQSNSYNKQKYNSGQCRMQLWLDQQNVEFKIVDVCSYEKLMSLSKCIDSNLFNKYFHSIINKALSHPNKTILGYSTNKLGEVSCTSAWCHFCLVVNQNPTPNINQPTNTTTNAKRKIKIYFLNIKTSNSKNKDQMSNERKTIANQFEKRYNELQFEVCFKTIDRNDLNGMNLKMGQNQNLDVFNYIRFELAKKQ